MKIVSMECPNCGASIRVDMDQKNLTCNYCGKSLFVDDEIQHVQYDNVEEAGYQFEKGRLRAQAEARLDNTQQFSASLQQKPKRKTWLWVLGWIFVFPVPLTILLLRKKEMNPILKYGIIAAAWILYLIIAFSGRSSGNSDNQSLDDVTVSSFDTSSRDNQEGDSDELVDSRNGEESNSSEDSIDGFVSNINSSGEVNLEFVEDFVPSDKNSGHYKTEFRLNAYKDTIGKSYKYGDTTADIILASNGAIKRIYMDGATYEQCESMIRCASSLLDSTATSSDVQEALNYISENKSANGYYYAKLGLVMLGGEDKGYEFMLKLQ